MSGDRVPVAAQRRRDLVRLRLVRDRIDREYQQPLDVEALARGVNMSAGHLSRQFRRAYGEPPYAYLMTRRIERAMALLRRGAEDSLTAMDITIHASFLPHDDPDASLAFYRDTLGFEVRNDVGYDGMRWITVGPADQPGTSVVLRPPTADPGVTADERRTVVEMMAKGTYAGILLATQDLDGTFERLRASGAEVVQEPTEQPYGVRDCAVRDPAGNLIRVQERR
jgi:AraC-like DNA-binding protein